MYEGIYSSIVFNSKNLEIIQMSNKRRIVYQIETKWSYEIYVAIKNNGFEFWKHGKFSIIFLNGYVQHDYNYVNIYIYMYLRTRGNIKKWK